MKELNFKNVPAGANEMVGWLIMLMLIVFGFRYIREIIEFILLKLYEYFVQHKF